MCRTLDLFCEYNLKDLISEKLKELHSSIYIDDENITDYETYIKNINTIVDSLGILFNIYHSINSLSTKKKDCEVSNA